MARAKTDLVEEVSNKIYLLIESGIKQNQIAETLGISGAVISLLKTKQYKADDPKYFQKYLSGINALLEDRSIIYTEDTKTENIEETYSDWLADQIQNCNTSPIELAEKAKVSALTITLILDGTTTNPQKGTKDKINNALKELNSSKTYETYKERKNDKPVIFTGLPYVESEINQVPNKKGVYAIHDRRGYPLYIGKGNVRDRLLAHKRDIAFVDPKVAYSFSYTVIQTGDDDFANKDADKESIWLENLLIKFAGNSVLLNIKLASDISE